MHELTPDTTTLPQRTAPGLERSNPQIYLESLSGPQALAKVDQLIGEDVEFSDWRRRIHKRFDQESDWQLELIKKADGQDIGFMLISSSRDKLLRWNHIFDENQWTPDPIDIDHSAQLAYFYIVPAERDKGHGERALKQLSEVAKNAGIHTFYGFASDKEPLHLYQKVGAQILGEKTSGKTGTYYSLSVAESKAPSPEKGSRQELQMPAPEVEDEVNKVFLRRQANDKDHGLGGSARRALSEQCSSESAKKILIDYAARYKEDEWQYESALKEVYHWYLRNDLEALPTFFRETLLRATRYNELIPLKLLAEFAPQNGGGSLAALIRKFTIEAENFGSNQERFHQGWVFARAATKYAYVESNDVFSLLLDLGKQDPQASLELFYDPKLRAAFEKDDEVVFLQAMAEAHPDVFLSLLENELENSISVFNQQVEVDARQVRDHHEVLRRVTLNLIRTLGAQSPIADQLLQLARHYKDQASQSYAQTQGLRDEQSLFRGLEVLQPALMLMYQGDTDKLKAEFFSIPPFNLTSEAELSFSTNALILLEAGNAQAFETFFEAGIYQFSPDENPFVTYLELVKKNASPVLIQTITTQLVSVVENRDGDSLAYMYLESYSLTPIVKSTLMDAFKYPSQQEFIIALLERIIRKGEGYAGQWSELIERIRLTNPQRFIQFVNENQDVIQKEIDKQQRFGHLTTENGLLVDEAKLQLMVEKNPDQFMADFIKKISAFDDDDKMAQFLREFNEVLKTFSSEQMQVIAEAAVTELFPFLWHSYLYNDEGRQINPVYRSDVMHFCNQLISHLPPQRVKNVILEFLGSQYAADASHRDSLYDRLDMKTLSRNFSDEELIEFYPHFDQALSQAMKLDAQNGKHIETDRLHFNLRDIYDRLTLSHPELVRSWILEKKPQLEKIDRSLGEILLVGYAKTPETEIGHTFNQENQTYANLVQAQFPELNLEHYIAVLNAHCRGDISALLEKNLSHLKMLYETESEITEELIANNQASLAKISLLFIDRPDLADQLVTSLLVWASEYPYDNLLNGFETLSSLELMAIHRLVIRVQPPELLPGLFKGLLRVRKAEQTLKDKNNDLLHATLKKIDEQEEVITPKLILDTYIKTIEESLMASAQPSSPDHPMVANNSVAVSSQFIQPYTEIGEIDTAIEKFQQAADMSFQFNYVTSTPYDCLMRGLTKAHSLTGLKYLQDFYFTNGDEVTEHMAEYQSAVQEPELQAELASSPDLSRQWQVLSNQENMVDVLSEELLTSQEPENQKKIFGQLVFTIYQISPSFCEMLIDAGCVKTSFKNLAEVLETTENVRRLFRLEEYQMLLIDSSSRNALLFLGEKGIISDVKKLMYINPAGLVRIQELILRYEGHLRGKVVELLKRVINQYPSASIMGVIWCISESLQTERVPIEGRQADLKSIDWSDRDEQQTLYQAILDLGAVSPQVYKIYRRLWLLPATAGQLPMSRQLLRLKQDPQKQKYLSILRDVPDTEINASKRQHAQEQLTLREKAVEAEEVEVHLPLIRYQEAIRFLRQQFHSNRVLSDQKTNITELIAEFSEDQTDVNDDDAEALLTELVFLLYAPVGFSPAQVEEFLHGHHKEGGLLSVEAETVAHVEQAGLRWDHRREVTLDDGLIWDKTKECFTTELSSYQLIYEITPTIGEAEFQKNRQALEQKLINLPPALDTYLIKKARPVESLRRVLSSTDVSASHLQALAGDLHKAVETFGIWLTDNLPAVAKATGLDSALLESLGTEIHDLILTMMKSIHTKETEEKSAPDRQVDIYVSKNAGSFFAKAAVGLCTAEDVALFQRPDHFHMNFVDSETREVMANLQLYVVDADFFDVPPGEQAPGQSVSTKKKLVIRGLNPGERFLQEENVRQWVKILFKAAERLAAQSNLDGPFVVSNLTEHSSAWHPHTNRALVDRVLQEYYRESQAVELLKPLAITGSEPEGENGTKIKQVYPLNSSLLS